MTGPRTYGGRSGPDRIAERRGRFIAAGLELMGTRGIGATTLRGVSAVSGVAARYFAESFPSIDDLHVAVFDQVANELEIRTMAAIAAAADKPKAQVKAGLAAVADLLLDDRRMGRIALIESASSPALGARRLTKARHFAAVVRAMAENSARAELLDIELTAQFVLNGVGGALTAVFTGEVEIAREHLVDRLTDLMFTTINGVPADHRALT